MARPSQGIEKYLLRYAEASAPEIARQLCRMSARHYCHVLVVPAHRELPRRIEQVVVDVRTDGDRFLFIVVSNCSIGTTDVHRRRHLAYEADLLGRHDWLEVTDGAYFCHWKNCDCLLISRSQGILGLAAKQGVGSARKIGTDVAVALYQRGRVRSPWLLQTDADVRLPKDYLSRADAADGEDAVALVYPFSHRDTERAGEEILAATLKYEAYLRYFVLGLAAARSPFAYHSLGSTLAVDAEAYVQVRGFPQRQAGEDFYLLNKLLKVGGIWRLAGSPLLIAARSSDRAPFGTGPAVDQILAGTPRGWEPQRAFDKLGLLLDHTRACSRGEVAPDKVKLGCVPGLQAVLNDALARGPTPYHTERRVMTWFDGLKTLRVVRKACPLGVPAVTALSSASFVGGSQGGMRPLMTSPTATVWGEVCATLALLEPRGVSRIVRTIP